MAKVKGGKTPRESKGIKDQIKQLKEKEQLETMKKVPVQQHVIEKVNVPPKPSNPEYLSMTPIEDPIEHIGINNLNTQVGTYNVYDGHSVVGHDLYTKEVENDHLSDTISNIFNKIIDYSRVNEHNGNKGLVLISNEFKSELNTMLIKNLPEQNYVKISLLDEADFHSLSADKTFNWVIVCYKNNLKELLSKARTRVRI